MSELHELLAVEGDLTGVAKKVVEEAKGTFKHNDRFLGQTRTLEMFDSARAGEQTTEVVALTTTVAAKLAYLREAVARQWNAVIQKEATNQTAKADIILPDGIVLAHQIPATALLGLETKLKELRDLYETIPTLAPGIEWVPDSSQVAADGSGGVYRANREQTAMKTEKTITPVILAPATDKHPAQVDKVPYDKPVGKYVTKTVSGMISPAQKSILLGRIDTLLRAVKQARQRANKAEVVQTEPVADLMFDFIHQS